MPDRTYEAFRKAIDAHLKSIRDYNAFAEARKVRYPGPLDWTLEQLQKHRISEHALKIWAEELGVSLSKELRSVLSD